MGHIYEADENPTGLDLENCSESVIFSIPPDEKGKDEVILTSGMLVQELEISKVLLKKILTLADNRIWREKLTA